MYAQVEKSKENKSRGVANTVGQQSCNVKQGFGFIDNRPENLAQTKLKVMANDSPLNIDSGSNASIQRMLGGAAATPTDRQRRINAVQAAIAAPGAVLPAAAGPGLLVFHPPTHNEQWEYTRTVQYTVSVPGLPELPDVIVRGHIHYTNSTGVVGPGRMWIGGGIVNDYSFPTPAAVVANFNVMPNFAARNAAVLAFNNAHGTTYATL